MFLVQAAEKKSEEKNKELQTALPLATSADARDISISISAVLLPIWNIGGCGLGWATNLQGTPKGSKPFGRSETNPMDPGFMQSAGGGGGGEKLGGSPNSPLKPFRPYLAPDWASSTPP